MIIIVAGKSIKGAVTITVPSSDPETTHSVAPVPTGGLGGNPPIPPKGGMTGFR